MSACFCVDHRIERFVLDLDEFGGIVGEAWGFGDHRRDRLALIADFVDGQGIVANFLGVVGTDFDEGLGLGGDFPAGDRADDAGQCLGGGGIDTEIFACA